MGLIQTLLTGRPNGLRARLRRRMGGGTAGPSSPKPPSAPPPVPAEAALGLKPEAPKDVTPPDGFEVVLHKDALKVGAVTEIIIGGRAIAVAHTEDGYRACTNTCPHAEGPLSEGELSGGVLTCPYHGWEFDLTSGACLTNETVTLPTFAVQVVGDAVCVRL